MHGDEGDGPVTRPHVVLLGHGAERTGPPILLAHLVRGLAAGGRYDLSVLTARSGPMLAEYEAAPARALAVSAAREPLGRTAAALRQVGAGSAVGPLQDARRRQVARRLAPADLVYVNGATPPTADLLRALDPPPTTPVVVHVHELDVGLRINLGDEQRRDLFDRADRIVAASGAVARLLVDGHGLAPERITTCAEFVDVAALQPLPPDEARAAAGIPAGAPVIGGVGLLDWRKDPDHLLRAVHALRRSDPDLDPWVLWVGGDPDSDDGRRTAAEARRLGLEDRFRHVGHQDHPDRLLGAMDVFALPSREDALPLAALEAAATGLPLVCFRAGGIADLCDLGAGTTVEYPDTAAFARALADLLADPEARARVGSAARALVRAEHDTGVGVARIAAVIDAGLEGGRR
ncbi:MAG TPA: glycosyltransferase family 4 protein [Acidimicrobiales bacterium]|nr:glycosyltransferase family 4 protein [Acidimicrobiales bacterium]